MTASPLSPPSGPDQTVGEILSIWMRRQRVSQTDMARALGLAQSTVSRKLQGDSPWLLVELVTACDVLGVSLPELFSWEAIPEWRARRDSNPKPSVLEPRCHLRLVEEVAA